MLKKSGAEAEGRKHGCKSRITAGQERSRVSVAYESHAQVYLWTTDRRRSPLIKR